MDEPCVLYASALSFHRCTSVAEMVFVFDWTGGDGSAFHDGIAARQATLSAWRGYIFYLQGVHVDHHPRVSVGGGLHREGRMEAGW